MAVTILYPTDFSKCAKDALEYLLEFIRVYPADRLVVVHSIIYNDSVFISSSHKEKENTERYNAARTELDSCIAYIKSKNAGLKVHDILDAGSAVQSIEEISIREKADLIVMGTKGATGLREKIIGSYSSEVISTTICPVLVIPEGCKFGGISNILCTAEFHESELKSVQELLKLTSNIKSRITFLNIGDSIPEQEKKCQYFIDKLNGKELTDVKFELIESDDIVKSIENYVVKHQTELLVTLGKRRDFWKRIAGIKVPESLSFHTNVPLLSFPFAEK